MIPTTQFTLLYSSPPKKSFVYFGLLISIILGSIGLLFLAINFELSWLILAIYLICIVILLRNLPRRYEVHVDRLKIWTIFGSPHELLYDDIMNIIELKTMACECCVTRYVATTSFDSGIRIDMRNSCFGVIIAPQNVSEFYRQLTLAYKNCTNACPWLPTFVEGRSDYSEHSQPLLHHPQYLSQPIPIYSTGVPSGLEPGQLPTDPYPSHLPVSPPFHVEPSAPQETQLYPNTHSI